MAQIIIYLMALQGLLFSKDEPIFIRSLALLGNESISENEISFVVRQKPSKLFFRPNEFNSRLVKLDALTLKKYYHSKGFMDVSIDESYMIKDGYAEIAYKIDEGKKYYLSKINITGNQVISYEEIVSLLGVKIGDPYNPLKINDNIILIENEYHEQGKLFHTINIRDIISDSVAVFFVINEGKDVIIQNTIFKGLGNIDSTIVSRELLYDSGQKYRRSIIDKTTQRLRETGVFSMVNFTPIRKAQSDSLTDIYFELKPFKQREWISEGGYNRMNFLDGIEPIDAIGLTIEWKNRSIFKTPTQLSTKLMGGTPIEVGDEQHSGLKEQEFFIHSDIGLTSNWILGVRLPSKLNFFYKRFRLKEQTVVSERYGIEVTQKVQIVEHSFIKSEFIWQSFSDQPQKYVEQRSIAVFVDRDKRDDPLFTHRGYYISGKLKSAGYVLGGERDYVKTDLTLQSYVPLGRKSVLAGRIKIGRIWGWDYNDDVAKEKFYLGGSTSMRGWEFSKFKTEEIDSTLGKGELIRLMTNIEYRFPIYRSIGMTIFSDGGILSSKMDSIAIRNVQWDGGIGITIDTPLGRARLDYAVQFDPPQTGKIQLGVQSLF